MRCWFIVFGTCRNGIVLASYEDLENPSKEQDEYLENRFQGTPRDTDGRKEFLSYRLLRKSNVVFPYKSELEGCCGVGWRSGVNGPFLVLKTWYY